MTTPEEINTRLAELSAAADELRGEPADSSQSKAFVNVEKFGPAEKIDLEE